MEAHNKRTEKALGKYAADIKAKEEKMKNKELESELERIKEMAYHGAAESKVDWADMAENQACELKDIADLLTDN